MELLFSGQLNCISSTFTEYFDRSGDKHKLVFSSNSMSANLSAKKANRYAYDPCDPEYEKLFSSHSFDAAIFFGSRPETGYSDFSEASRLEAFLRHCIKFSVEKVIFVSSTSIYNTISDTGSEKSDLSIINSISSDSDLLLYTCEQICETYRNNYGLEILSIRIPVLYGHFEKGSLVGDIVCNAVLNDNIEIPFGEELMLDFLSSYDLADLIFRVIDDWSLRVKDKITSLSIGGKTQLTAAQFAELIKSAAENFEVQERDDGTDGVLAQKYVTFVDTQRAYYPPVVDDSAYKYFQWFPCYGFDEKEVKSLFKDSQRMNMRRKNSILERIKSRTKDKVIIVEAIEIILGFIAVEILNAFSDTAVQFRYADFRMLYVVLIANTYGLSGGIISALLMCVSVVIGFFRQGTNWRFIIYDANNWLPFACYILLGCIIGYTLDRRKNDLKYVTEERDNLSDRYAFLNKLYGNALSSKGQFKRQIMSYRGSFGRVFNVAHKLNSVVTSEIFFEAVNALEDIMENKSIAIYHFNEEHDYVRVVCCSREISNMPISMPVSNIRELVSEFKRDHVWKNIKCKPELPDYAFPIYDEDSELIGFISIQKAEPSQMVTYYENMFKIFCSLISESVVRAYHYRNDSFYPGTRLCKPEFFATHLKAYENMQKNNGIDFQFFPLNTDEKNLFAVYEICASVGLRDNDIFGVTEDGRLGIILFGATPETTARVVEKIKNKMLEVGISGRLES